MGGARSLSGRMTVAIPRVHAGLGGIRSQDGRGCATASDDALGRWKVPWQAGPDSEGGGGSGRWMQRRSGADRPSHEACVVLL